jgi:Fur family ferric uptake transcriptional regulator
MNTNPYDVEKAKEVFNEYLVKNGLRKTTERNTILEHICRIQGHFDIDALYKALEIENFHVSKASIYNTIDLLMNVGLVVRHQFTSKLVEYELRAAALGHHHLVCTKCGRVAEMKSDRMIRQLASMHFPKFTYDFHSLYVYGMCSKCKFRLMRKKTENK